MRKQRMKLVVMGPPGAGKGTQSGMIKSALGIPSISTGDILRKAQAEGSPLGKEIKELIANGFLLPDDIVIEIVKNRISKEDCKNGYILDGFPRTVPQAEALDKIDTIDFVLFVDVPDDEIKKRMASRKTCRSCGATFGTEVGISCIKCGGELYVRDDDRPESVGKRLEVYRQQTVPLTDYYRKQGKLKVVSGVGTIAEIAEDIADTLGICKEGAL